jgi:hypothetical protein
MAYCAKPSGITSACALGPLPFASVTTSVSSGFTISGAVCGCSS